MVKWGKKAGRWGRDQKVLIEGKKERGNRSYSRTLCRYCIASRLGRLDTPVKVLKLVSGRDDLDSGQI
jgi:hypothetical protein